MRKYVFTGLLVVVSFIYCFSQTTIKSKPSENYLLLDTVNFKVFKLEKLIESSKKIKAIAQFAGNEYYIYLDHISDTTFSNPLRFFNPSIDSVLFWNDVCPLLDYMSYVSGLDTLFVYRYQWVIKKEAHDQAYIYCNPEHGLFAMDLFHVGILYYYEMPLIPKDIESKLLNDILRDRF